MGYVVGALKIIPEEPQVGSSLRVRYSAGVTGGLVTWKSSCAESFQSTGEGVGVTSPIQVECAGDWVFELVAADGSLISKEMVTVS